MKANETPGRTRAAIYARISHDPDESRLGVQRQEDDCRREITRRGWSLDDRHVFVDDDLSASGNVDRPRYRDMLDAIGAGLVRAVVVWDVDRLQRNLREFVEFIDACEVHGTLVCWRSGEADFATGRGIDELEMRAMFARSELRKMRERITRKHQQMAETGQTHGGDSWGYRYDKGRKTLVVVPEDADLIREAARRLLVGESIYRLCQDWLGRGVVGSEGKPWRPPNLAVFLRRARLAGLREWRGKVSAEGDWEPILDRDEWERLRGLLGDPQRPRYDRQSPFLLSGGVARCGNCGDRLYGRRRERGIRLYRCVPPSVAHGCGRVSMAAEPLEMLVVDALLNAADTKDLSRVVESSDEGSITAELETVEDKLIHLGRDYAEDRITRAEWEVMRGGLAQRLERLNHRLQIQRRSQVLAEIRGPLRQEWPTLPMRLQRAAVAAYIERVSVNRATRLVSRSIDPDRVGIVWRV